MWPPAGPTERQLLIARLMASLVAAIVLGLLAGLVGRLVGDAATAPEPWVVATASTTTVVLGALVSFSIVFYFKDRP